MMSKPNKKAKTESSASNELEKLKPLLKGMEKEGKLLDCVLEAFRGHELLLADKIKASLPDEWMKAPDQRVILEHNWNFEDDDDDDNPRKLDFKSDAIRLGCYSGRRDVKRKDIHTSKDSVWYSIDEGGCEECSGEERYDFELRLNPRTAKYQLVIEEYVTCQCDGEETRCEEEDFVAYMA